MASAVVPTSFQLLVSGSSRSFSRLSLFHQALLFPVKRSAQLHGVQSSAGVHCTTVRTAASETETKKKSSFELQTLTTWLLKQEQAGSIDAELTIVLSSISMACKQIASLVQRAGISNLTGVQGAVNVQGEDQKKLDVVSNEVSTTNPGSPSPSPTQPNPIQSYSIQLCPSITNLPLIYLKGT